MKSTLKDGMGWDRLAGTGVATAQKIVQRPTPFLTRHSASRLKRIFMDLSFGVNLRTWCYASLSHSHPHPIPSIHGFVFRCQTEPNLQI